MARVRVALWLCCVTAACGGLRQTQQQPREPVPAPAPVVQPLPPLQPLAPRPAPLPMYALDEVLADVLSGPLQHIGTGPWQGISRSHACAYHNDRVIVVNVYCTIKESNAVRIDVYSPTRGRARLYAEASFAISPLRRGEYFSFTGESQPAPLRRAGLPPLRMDMTFSELQSYERQRYEKYLPACYGGMEMNRPQGGCLGELKPYASAWSRRNQSFLNQPPEDWYRVVKDLRALALQHGHDR